MSKTNFSNMSTDTLRHAREYGWIYLTNQQLYQFIQEIFPTFSIERLVELRSIVKKALNGFTSDQEMVFNALKDASQYEVYAEGSDVTILSPDVLDLPYPYIELTPGTYSIVIDDIESVLAVLEINNILKFKPTNRNSFAYMEQEGIKGLSFNEELFNAEFSKSLSLDHVYSYALNIKRHKDKHKNYKHVRYNMLENTIYLDDLEPIKGTRKDYEDICLSISQLL